jgi:hypothetical protein
MSSSRQEDRGEMSLYKLLTRGKEVRNAPEPPTTSSSNRRHDMPRHAMPCHALHTKDSPMLTNPSKTTRPPARHSPRLRLGRLLSLPQPGPQQIPNRRRLPALLLRLHTSPGLHLRRNARIPLRAGTHARTKRNQKRAAVLSRLGGWSGLRPADSPNRGDGR